MPAILLSWLIQRFYHIVRDGSFYYRSPVSYTHLTISSATCGPLFCQTLLGPQAFFRNFSSGVQLSFRRILEAVSYTHLNNVWQNNGPQVADEIVKKAGKIKE